MPPWDFTVIGDSFGDGTQVYNGFLSTDAATLTVGGNFTLDANSYLLTQGASPLTVAGNVTLGADSYFENYGLMTVGGVFDSGTGAAGNNNTIGGTFTAAPGSQVTTNTSTWQVLTNGTLAVAERATFTVATDGTLLIDEGGFFLVDAAGTFNQVGTFLSIDSHKVTWTWTGNGGDGNWSTAANWNAAVGPSWGGGPTNAYPGEGAIAGELDFVSIDTGIIPATITIRASDNLAVQSLNTGTGAALVIDGGSLSVSANSLLRGALALTGGQLAVQGSKTKLEATGATTVVGASLLATNGATLSLPNLQSYANAVADSPTFFTASGAGSLLNLPALATLGTLASPWTLRAWDNGVVNLPALAIDGGNPNIIQDAQTGGQIYTVPIVDVATTFTITGGTFNGYTYNVAADATLNIYGGTFSGTTFNLAAGAKVAIWGGTFSGVTTWNVAGGATVTVSGIPTVSGFWTGAGLGTIELAPWRLYIGAGGWFLNFAGDMLEWTGGIIDAGLGNLTNLGTRHLTGTLTKRFYNDGIIDNFGTIIQSSVGYLFLGTDNIFPCVLKNEQGALYQIEGDGGIGQVQDRLGSAFFPSVDNAGTIRKIGGTGVSTFHLDGSLTNTGTIEVSSGTLHLDADVLPQVISGTLTGGVWKALNGATLQFPAGTSITASAANLTLSGAGAAMTGLAGLNTNSGSFTLANGADFSTEATSATAAHSRSGRGACFRWPATSRRRRPAS